MSESGGDQGRAGDPDGWDGGWERHADARAQAGLAATPAQRLAWLEEAIEFSRTAILEGHG